MRTILPRIRNLLAILLNGVKPQPVNTLADQLKVSRRTVYRELENLSSILGEYGLVLDTLPGEGIMIGGDDAGRVNLQKTLGNLGKNEPVDRDERQARLILSLLENPDSQKLFSHADKFKVSVSTISHDLDEIEPWLTQYRVAVVRKSGAGAAVSGQEAAYRRALLGVVYQQRENSWELGFPDPTIVVEIDELLGDCKPACDWIAPHSLVALSAYLAVSVQRILIGYALSENTTEGTPSPLAEMIADRVQAVFGIDFNKTELAALDRELSACLPAAGLRAPGLTDDDKVVRLAYSLIEQFDAEKAPLLKLDQVLMDGLTSYLPSALVRIRDRIELPDPFMEQIAENYPDILEKTKRAAHAIPGAAEWLPQSEASLLAPHFAAAVMRFADQAPHRRRARMGVVCVYGIGTSYLLASQIRKHFDGEAEIEVACLGDSGDWNSFDMLVSTSTIPEATMPVIVVPIMLRDADVQTIRDALARLNFMPAEEKLNGDSSIESQVRRIESVVSDVRILLDKFSVVKVHKDCDFFHLVKTVSNTMGKGKTNRERIAAGLLAREEVSTQVVPELGLVLLHCRTSGVQSPLLSLFVPEGGRFIDSYFHETRSCVAMVIPEHCSRIMTELMGGINLALLEDEAFLCAVLDGDAEKARFGLDKLVRQHLNRIW